MCAFAVLAHFVGDRHVLSMNASLKLFAVRRTTQHTVEHGTKAHRTPLQQSSPAPTCFAIYLFSNAENPDICDVA